MQARPSDAIAAIASILTLQTSWLEEQQFSVFVLMALQWS